MKHYFNYELAEKLCDKVHGSGLDTSPRILDTFALKYVQILWEFHLMDEDGYYDGYWDFTLKIPRDNPQAFTITGRSNNHRRKSTYGIKDYLYDIFAQLMDETLQEAGISWELVNEKIYPGDKDYDPNVPFAQEHGYHFGRAHYEYAGELQEV
jgi:hypothetical protein